MLQNALAGGATIVAANARAARAIRLTHAEQQRANGLEMWSSPAIFDWDSWLTFLWKDLDAAAPLLLAPLQEHALWKRVQREEAKLVVSPDGLASLAQSAYSLLSKYQLHDARKFAWLETDAEHFRQWARAFTQLCRENNWASRSDLESHLTAAVQSGKLELPKRILFAGFDRLTPAQESFLQNLRDAGTQVEHFPSTQADSSTSTLLIADDQRDELLACAQWCRSQLERDPTKHIGVITPDAGSIRAEAERIFRAVLMPQSLDIAANIAAMPFEFSLGVPLSTVPAIRAALLLVRWIITPLPEDDIAWLLLSGFLSGHSSEIVTLAQFDYKQRDSGSLSPETSLSSFIRNLTRNNSTELHAFAERMRSLAQAVDKDHALTERSTHTYWCELVEQLLHLAGWPGFRKPDSAQFQAQKRWQHLLDEVALLDFAGRNVSFVNFLQALERHANDTIFTPESHNAPIQILGALESSGQTFDALWFLGADDSQWPLTGRPHPLLPISIQHQAQMPHSSAAVDTDLASIVTTRIANSAHECVFSYARQNKEGEQRPSPLLAAIFAEERQTISTAAYRKQLQVAGPAKIEPSLEVITTRSEIIPWPSDRIAGGADVLKEQAACPFQAFAKRRLAAQTLNSTEWGLNAAERGKLLHRILENLWSPHTLEALRMVSLDDLRKAIAAQRLDEILAHHIGNAFYSLTRDYAEDPWMRAYFASEQDRLFVLLHEWLRCETERQPFEVEAREQRLQDVSVGALKLNLRADRIDALPDGTHLLIDYKTSDMSAADWQGNRPDEPQLPLYAVYGNVANVSGLLFAQIRAGSTGVVGRVANAQQQLHASLSANSALVSQPYNESMRNEWEEALLHLAEEFLRGEASVNPKHGAETCKYCPLPGLCRIAETNLAIDNNEDAEAGDD